MISAVLCLVLPHIGSVILPQQGLPDAKKDWLYIGKEVRVIQFEVNSDVPSDKSIFTLNHASGYIVLKEREFWISVASMMGTSLARYENGALERTQDPAFEGAILPKKKESVKLDYLPALTASLNESVDQGFGELLRDILAKDSRQSAPKSVVEEKPHGVARTCDFIGSWRALKRVTWYSRGTLVRTVCEFKLVLP